MIKILELDVSSVKLDICEDLPGIKKLFKVLTIRKTEKTFTTTDKVEEPQMNSTRNRAKNTPVKHTDKKKALSIIVGLLRQLQSDI